jgi:putative DNA primase/helicase
MQCYPFIHSDDPSAERVEGLQLVRAADCPAQNVEWLWPGKIAIGKVTLLIGDPGTGKSLVALDIAARLSSGSAWPDHKAATAGRANDIDERRQGDKERGRQGESNADQQISLSPCLPVSLSSHSKLRAPCSTLILSATDDLADTIRPRLDAAGADPRRVFFIPSIADLRDDFAQLRAAVHCAPNCRLIIIDPINAYVGPSDAVSRKS